MISFIGKKSNSQKVTSAGQITFPAKQRLALIKRFISSVKIGSRIRYHQEFEEASELESLIVGYQINDIQVFMQSDIEFVEDELSAKLIIRRDGEREELTRIEDFALIVPDTAGEELKLDYDSRANLSRRGPFAPRSHLVVFSTHAKSEHLIFEADVKKHLKLKQGVHSGLVVVLLDVAMGTIASHEPRKHARIDADLCVTASKNGSENPITARLKDFSEEYVCLHLDDDELEPWPEFGKKDFLLVGMKTSIDKPLVKLRCEFIEQRGAERVFKMTHIFKQGKQVAFQMLDALEIKIDLLNYSSDDRS